MGFEGMEHEIWQYLQISRINHKIIGDILQRL
jgi:hypothetical protein